MHTLTLHVANMHCGACVRRVSQLLNSLPSTHAEEVRIGQVRLRTGQTAVEVCAALADAGYPASMEPAPQ